MSQLTFSFENNSCTTSSIGCKRKKVLKDSVIQYSQCRKFAYRTNFREYYSITWSFQLADKYCVIKRRYCWYDM